MYNSDENKWVNTSSKSLRCKRNKEFVTGRVLIRNRKYTIHIGIGLLICDLISFKKNDLVEILSHKKDRNLLMIRKTISPEKSHILNYNTHCNSNFLRFCLREQIHENYKISQTIILDYEFNDKNLLLVSLEKLKWEK